MPRLIYALIYCLSLPFLYFKYLLRSINNPDYRHHLSERVSLKLPTFQTQPIHIHLVSVGEANAAQTLINRLIARYPTSPFLITVTTPTGRVRIRTLFAHHKNVTVRYLPFDMPLLMSRFLTHVRPKVTIILETELWPYFLLYAKRLNIPVALVNARLSKKSLKGYLKLPKTSKAMITSLDLVLAQYKPDHKRLLRLGCEPNRVKTIGNIKFDIDLPTDAIEQGQKIKATLNRPTWIAASTHEGEESIILEVHKRLKVHYPNLLLVLVPRHQERFNDVAQLCKDSELTLQRYSDNKRFSAEFDVLLGDTIGDMYFYLSLVDVCFIGGSLVKSGGHNPIEPAALGLPILTGPHVFNFKTVFKRCQKKQFCTMVNNAQELQSNVNLLFNNDSLRQEKGEKAQSFVRCNKGSTDLLIREIAPLIENETVNERPLTYIENTV